MGQNGLAACVEGGVFVGLGDLGKDPVVGRAGQPVVFEKIRRKRGGPDLDQTVDHPGSLILAVGKPVRSPVEVVHLHIQTGTRPLNPDAHGHVFWDGGLPVGEYRVDHIAQFHDQSSAIRRCSTRSWASSRWNLSAFFWR